MKNILKQVREIDNVEVISFIDAESFEFWLVNNYQRREGIWLKIAKKNSKISSINSDEAVDIGLCWGWISGQRRLYDKSYYIQKYVPRRSKSMWSQVNVNKVESLTTSGKMRISGLAEVAAAKTDGRWNAAYASQRNMTMPLDLIEGLKQNKVAGTLFSKLNKTEQYTIILKLIMASNIEKRATRLKKIIISLNSRELTL